MNQRKQMITCHGEEIEGYIDYIQRGESLP